MSISRPDEYGVQVRVRRSGHVHSRYFAFGAHGGVRAAMAAARAYEARLERLPIFVPTEPTKRNRTTGVRGVSLTKYRPAGKKHAVFEYKVTYSDRKTGRRRVRSFYVGTTVTHSKRRAAAVLRKAIEFRNAMTNVGRRTRLVKQPTSARLHSRRSVISTVTRRG